jgi:transcriptional regulator with XRE-family HTH domain
MSPTAVSPYCRGEHVPTPATLARFLKALGATGNDFRRADPARARSRTDRDRAAAILAERGTLTSRQAAAKHGMSRATVRAIWQGRRWPALQRGG